MKPPRPRYPRINCSVPGCKRGTTIYEPGTRMICGKCWRRAPQNLRKWYSYWRRKGTTLERREDPRADACHQRCNAAWERILAVLTAPVPEGEEVPPIMAEELRKLGLG